MDEKVKMVRHQAVAKQISMGQNMLFHKAHKVGVILRFKENRLAIISLIVNVINLVKFNFHVYLNGLVR